MRIKHPGRVLGSVLLLVLLCARASAGASSCPGNCSGDTVVTVDELVLGVNMALGDLALAECPPFDGNGDGFVTVDELILAVNAALNGCPVEQLASPTPSPSPMPTATVPPGPEITFFGIARADNTLVEPAGTTVDGIQIYERPTRFGFMIVVEARPGDSGKSLSSFGTINNPATGSSRSHLQILANNALGNGSTTVCDAGPLPDPIGGVPGVNPVDFGPSATITDAVNDFACRFDFHVPSAAGPGGCTVDKLGNFSFASEEIVSGMRQYCSVPAVGRELAFPSGDTKLTVQLADSGSNLGKPAKIVLRIP